jgi:hypothetical protein
MRLKTIAAAVAATAGNALHTYTNSSSDTLRILWAQLSLVTGATVANRTVNLLIYDGAGTPVLRLSIVAGAVATASLTTRFDFFQDIARETAIAATALKVPIPKDLFIPPGWSFKFSVTNGVAGDSYSGNYMLAEVVA